MDCDGCTMCCKLLPIADMDSPSGVYCKECNITVGCKIYNKRPEDCKMFNCAYKQVEIINTDLNPDKCGVIFEKATSKIFLGTIDDSVFCLPDIVKVQIDMFLKQGFSVVLRHLKIKTPYVFCAEGYKADKVLEEMKEAWQRRII